MKLSIQRFALACLLFTVARPALSEGTVEAVLGPAIGYQKISEDWKSGSRTQYSLDFTRISAGVSLNVTYGKGLGYTDYGAALRMFGTWKVLPSSDMLSLWYGVGGGARYASDVTASVVGMSKSFARIYISPFVRVLCDLNGWVAPFLDLSYDIGVARFGDGGAAAGIKSSFVASLGIAFEIER